MGSGFLEVFFYRVRLKKDQRHGAVDCEVLRKGAGWRKTRGMGRWYVKLIEEGR